ncbi:MAG TPA: hypothetical protein VFI46_02790 [Jiangellaceae bacterium]|nr:hypothetical protein [Jiangellaceae bacterium]
MARLLFVGALAVPGAVVAPTGAATQAAASLAAQPVQEVRPIDTTELGLSKPTGVAYLPSQNALVVAARRAGQTPLIRVTPVEDFLGSLVLPDAEAITLTANPAANSIYVIAGQDLLTVRADQLSAAAPQPGRASLGAALLGAPAGATFDASGGLLILDAEARAIVRVQDGDPARGVTRISLGQMAGEAPLRGLAMNPADGLIYVGSPTEQLLYGLDGSGVVRARYDLSPLGLADPQGFTFAPSADSTDARATQHLYIADGGGQLSLGGVMEASLTMTATITAASVVTATLVQRIATSAWSPASPDPSGIVYVPAVDRLEVVDSEVDETTGAGYHNVNLWQITRAGAVTDTGTTWLPAPAFSREPTGLGFGAAPNTLFISDDSADKVWIDRPGPDLRFGTADDVVTSIDTTQYGSFDTEDPEYDPSTGHLFFIDGVNVEVYDIDPVDGFFGNGNDTMTHFDMSQYGPTDLEGLSSDPAHNTLLVGGRITKQIYEVTKTGALVQTIDASGISGMRNLSGLAHAPASDNPARRDYWIVDRNTDNGPFPTENDGQLFELRTAASGNTAPVVNAGPDQTIASPTTSVSVSGTLNDDGLPNPPGTATHTWSQVNGPAAVTFGDASALTTTASGFTTAGDYTLRLTASDGELSSSDDLTVHVVINQAPVVTAGADQTITQPTSTVNVSGTVSDDAFPNPPGTTTHTWSQVSGPATVTFGDASALATTAGGFSALGDYVLRLTADDSALSSHDELTIHIVAPEAPPAAPTSLETSVTSISVDLDWGDNSEADLAGYNVYRGAQSSGPFAKLNSAPLTVSQYRDVSAPAGTSYYQVTAVDLAGHESAPAVASAVRTILFRAAASRAAKDASTLTIPTPAGTTAGDLLVAAVDVRSTPTITGPPGWTVVRTDTNASAMRQAIYVKIATPTEPSSHAWSFSARNSAAGIIVAYQGTDPSTPVDASSGQPNPASTSITAPALSTTVPGALLVGFFGTVSNPSITPPPGMIEQTETIQNAGKNKISLETADTLLAATGSSGTRTATASQGSANIGQLIAIRPLT